MDPSIKTIDHFTEISSVYPFQSSVAFYIEISQLIYCANQMTDFYMKCKNGLKWVNLHVSTFYLDYKFPSVWKGIYKLTWFSDFSFTFSSFTASTLWERSKVNQINYSHTLPAPKEQCISFEKSRKIIGFWQMLI